MRVFLTLLSIFLFLGNSYAQNYQCVYTNRINYFTNSNHYLRGIRIDSTKIINGNTILYPYKTARGPYWGNKPSLYPGGSWFGETITIQPGGTHLIRNYAGDTVVIKTQAALNDTWIFYDDADSIYYEATMTGKDTMTVTGSVDTVKIITLTAKDQHGVRTSDPLNNYTIILSKYYGLVKTIDLYVFPAQRDNFTTNGFDYYTARAGSIDFNLVKFANPSKMQVYGREVGDVIEIENHSIPYTVIAYTLDSIMYKTYINADTVIYTIRRIVRKTEIGQNGYVQKVSIDTFLQRQHSGSLFDMTKLPEEWGMDRTMQYNPLDSQFCYIDKAYAIFPSYVYHDNGSAYVNTFEPCDGPNYTYKLGIGELTYSYCTDPSAWVPYWFTIYVRKNGVPCGRYVSLDVPSVSIGQSLSVFPNPATDKIVVELRSQQQLAKLMLFNMDGRLLKSETVSGNLASISVSELPSGLYQLRVIDDVGNHKTNKISVQH